MHKTSLALIEPDSNQPRRSFSNANIKEVAASLESVGQINPIELIQIGERRFQAKTGHYRYWAAKGLGSCGIGCILITQPLAEEEVRLGKEQRDQLKRKAGKLLVRLRGERKDSGIDNLNTL